MRLRYGCLFAVSVLFCMSTALAMPVYVFSSGNTTDDKAVADALTAAGHTPIIGVTPDVFDGSQADLKTFKVIVLVDNYSDADRPIPIPGQVALLSFINSGGGLVTGEWVVWGVNGMTDYDQALGVAFPTTSKDYYSGSSTSYIQATPDSILNSGVPSSFNFQLNDIGGTESVFVPKVAGGAVTYYTSSQTGTAGLVGWQFGSGRVISFSTLLTNKELGNSQYKKLFVNTVQWAAPSVSFTFKMSKSVYSRTDTVTINDWRLSNTRPTSVTAELKVWLKIPGSDPIALINLGSDGSLKMPPSVDIPLLSAPLTLPGLPPGAYEIGGRALQPATGSPYSETVASWTVQ
jgi:hypothetical protein